MAADLATRDGLADTVRALQVGQHLLFAALLLVCTTRALSEGATPFAQLPAALALMLWYVLGVRLARSRTSGRTRGTAVAWLLGLVLLWCLLAVISAENVWIAFSLWLLAGHLLPLGPALAVSGAILAVVLTAPLAHGRETSYAALIGPTLGALVALGVARAQARLVRESRARQEMLARLLRAQEETATLTEELARSQRDAGVLAERTRLSRDIHDTLAQGFSAILMLSRAGAAEQDVEARTSLLRQIETTAAENLDEARRVVGALAPGPLESGSFPAALGRILQRLTEQTGIEATLDVDPDLPPLTTGTEVVLLRAAQSALANVRAHSQAAAVRVTVTAVPDPGGQQMLRLDVVDDGRGFDASRSVPPGEGEDGSLRGGYGLLAMSARLREIGGSLEVESAPGEGTAVCVAVPIPAPSTPPHPQERA